MTSKSILHSCEANKIDAGNGTYGFCVIEVARAPGAALRVAFSKRCRPAESTHSTVKQELGFLADRFAPLTEETIEEEEYVTVGSGKAYEWEPQVK